MTCESCLTYAPDDAPDWWFVSKRTGSKWLTYDECPECGEDDDT